MRVFYLLEARAQPLGRNYEWCNRLGIRARTKNACSMLYSACARAAQAMGYDKIQTYILVTEPGTTLKASGWYLDKELCGDKRGTRFHKNRKDSAKRQEVGHEQIRNSVGRKTLRRGRKPRLGASRRGDLGESGAIGIPQIGLAGTFLKHTERTRR
jgi:hypothetical protein